MDKEDIIAIYKELLKGNRKRFPYDFWKKDGKEKSIIIFKYLFEEILNLAQEDLIENLDYNLISNYKLTTPFSKYFNQCIGNLLKGVYPNIFHGRLPMAKETRMKISAAQKNLSKEKHENIVRGMRDHRYTKEYAKKLSDTKLGEINPQHKLKAVQVIEIKKLWETGIYTTASLGEKYKISRQTIADIVYGRTWKHIK